jgi:hypothetical protein
MPPGRIGVPCGKKRQPVRDLGKNLDRRATRTGFPQAIRCGLCISLWKNFGQNVANFFSCTAGGLDLGRSQAVTTDARFDYPQRYPPNAHRLATGSQQVIHKVVLALAPRDARIRAPDVRPVW